MRKLVEINELVAVNFFLQYDVAAHSYLAHSYLEVPLYVSLIKELTLLDSNQSSVINSSLGKMKIALKEFRMDGKQIVVDNLWQIVDQLREEVSMQLQKLYRLRWWFTLVGATSRQSGETEARSYSAFYGALWKEFFRSGNFCSVMFLYCSQLDCDQVQQVMPSLKHCTTYEWNHLGWDSIWGRADAWQNRILEAKKATS